MGGNAPNVSRETSDRLDAFESLVRKWSPRINLVSKADLADLRSRHIEDSLQLVDLVPDPGGHWVDLGSGGGFPGVVMACVAKEIWPDTRFTLVESDKRKAAFLRACRQAQELDIRVLSERIEALPNLNATYLSARALADLDRLLGFAETHLAPGGTALFPKGITWKKEVEAARKAWNFTCIDHKSKTNSNAVILEIGEIARV